MANFTRLVVTILLVSLFGMQGARGQERKGSISGHATDTNHDALVGARAEVQPNGHAVTTDAQGAFIISDLAPGKYTLTITYVGFKPFSTDVTVEPGGVTSAEEMLAIESVNEQIIVRGERERGEIEALNREINADNIVQVLPAEVITSLPNTNIADAVGRLPSVPQTLSSRGAHRLHARTRPRLRSCRGVAAPRRIAPARLPIDGPARSIGRPGGGSFR